MDPASRTLTDTRLKPHAPKRWLLRILYTLTHSEIPWIRRLLIRSFIRAFAVDLDDAAEPNPDAYPHFNAFFTRGLREGVRPQAQPPALNSPVDGALVSYGHASPSSIVTVKGQDFTWHGLIPDTWPHGDLFDPETLFFNCYLSPRDYHRVHMPCAGQLTRAEWIPGRFRSVHPSRVRRHPDTLAQNERVLLLLTTEHGPLLLILVAARLVGGIETPWCPSRLPWREPDPSFQETLAKGVGTRFERGEEIGRFNYGSSVLVLVPGSSWQPMHELGTIRLGARLALPSSRIST